VDLQHLRKAYDALQACYDPLSAASRTEEGAADARFHLAIAEASHNAVLLHTIRGLFALLKRNVVTNIGGMYAQRTETRDMLMTQHGELYRAIMAGEAQKARECSDRHIHYVQEVLADVLEESHRVARAQRRQSL
jgi:GntR family transcriptional repressor for pyruvate dehydrogenase complex